VPPSPELNSVHETQRVQRVGHKGIGAGANTRFHIQRKMVCKFWDQQQHRRQSGVTNRGSVLKSGIGRKRCALKCISAQERGRLHRYRRLLSLRSISHPHLLSLVRMTHAYGWSLSGMQERVQGRGSRYDCCLYPAPLSLLPPRTAPSSITLPVRALSSLFPLLAVRGVDNLCGEPRDLWVLPAGVLALGCSKAAVSC